MERIARQRNRPHAVALVLALAGTFGAVNAWCSGASPTPFAPEVTLDDERGARLGLITNHFPVDPPTGNTVQRSPWLLKLSAVPLQNLAIEGILGDRAGLSLRVRLMEQETFGADVTVGMDELFFAADQHLFGNTHDGGESDEENRVWIGLSRAYSWMDVRAAVAALPGGKSTEYVPFTAMNFHLPADILLGWETAYAHEVWQNHLGVGIGWKPFDLAFGFSNLQSWLVRDGAWGWHNSARTGSTNGHDNPGWWFAISLPIPKPRAPMVAPIVKAAPAGVDSNALNLLADRLLERQVRADIAELVVRRDQDESDPNMALALRARIQSVGLPARKALWNIVLDGTADQRERRQALLTLEDDLTPKELDLLAQVAQDPVRELRMEVALVLPRFSGNRARDLLRTLRRDPEALVRDAVNVATQP